MIGQYKIIKAIGEGGFGRTYLAEHQVLKKKVVLKQSLFQSQAAHEILLGEASILWDVNHWALPTVKDVIVTEDLDLVMAMSFIEGQELFGHVKSHGPLDPETACWIGQRILSALYYLHFHGIIHRDVKPANIIVNFDTHIATLVDFGLSKLKPDGTPDPSGYTPIFGAPEQVQGKPPIPESDLYSLGMTLCYILGGEVRTKDLSRAVPEPIRKFVHSLVREDPQKRPRDCNQLNQDLSRIRKAVFGRSHSM